MKGIDCRSVKRFQLPATKCILEKGYKTNDIKFNCLSTLCFKVTCYFNKYGTVSIVFNIDNHQTISNLCVCNLRFDKTG